MKYNYSYGLEKLEKQRMRRKLEEGSRDKEKRCEREKKIKKG